MIFAGIVSLFLYCFFIGTVFAEKLESKSNFVSYLINSIIISLFISWILVFFSQITEFNIDYKIIVLVVILFHLVNILKKNEKIKIKRNFFSIFIFLILLVFIASNPFKHSYEIVFQKYDSIVTWNQWATDLYNYDYMGYRGYPVLFPGLWSLIYHSQNNVDFWIITKISTIIPVLLCLLVILDKFLKKNYQFSIYIFFGFLILFYSNPIFDYLVSGYMDVPLSLFSLTSLFLMASILLEKKNKSFTNSLYQISFLVGLSLIIKQAAVFLLFTYLVFIFIIRKKIKFTISYILIHSLIIFLPFVLFLIISFESLFSFSLIKELSNLSLVENKNTFLFQSILHMLRIYNPFVLFFLLFFSLTSFIKFNSKNLFDIFSILCFFVFLVLFVFTTSCCSYDERNFFYTAPFILISSFNGLKHCLLNLLSEINSNKKFIIKKNYLNKFSVLFFLLTCILSFIVGNSEEALLKLNNYKRSFLVDKISTKEIVKIVERSKCTKLYTNEMLLTYNTNIKKIRKNFIFVYNLNLEEIKKIKPCKNGNIIWFGYWSPRDIKNWNEIEKYLIEEKAARLDLNDLIFKLN